MTFPLIFQTDTSGSLLHGLSSGTKLRVHLTVEHADSKAPDGKELVGRLRVVDENGVTLGYRYEGEEVEEPIPWEAIRLVEARFRAFFRGLTAAALIGFPLGYCGRGLDGLTDGFPDHRHDLQNIGIAIGIVIGLLIWVLTFEWTRVYEAEAAATPAQGPS